MRDTYFIGAGLVAVATYLLSGAPLLPFNWVAWRTVFASALLGSFAGLLLGFTEVVFKRLGNILEELQKQRPSS